MEVLQTDVSFPVDHLRWGYHGPLTLNVVRDLEACGCSQEDGEHGHSASDNISTLGTVVSEDGSF